MTDDNHINPDENVPQFMTIDEVSQRLKGARSTVYRFIEREENPLPVIYLSDKTPRIPWDQFELWLEETSKQYSKGGE